MGEVRVPAAALWAAQTQRAVENFPISGRPIEPAQIRALGLVKGAVRAGEQGPRRARRRPRRRRRRGGRRGRLGRARRPVPDRRVPDRLGHQLEHERQRGHRDAGLAGVGGHKVHPNDHVNASQSSQRRLPDDHPPGRHRGDRPRHDPGARPPRRRAQPHAPRTGSTSSRPGAPTSWTPCRSPSARRPAAGPASAATAPSGCARPCPGSPSCRSAAPPSAPGSTRPEGFGAQVVEKLRQATEHPRAHRGPRPHRGPGRPRRARRGVRRAAHRRRQPLQDRQRPPLDVARARRPASPRSTCPTCSRAARSCRARSTR